MSSRAERRRGERLMQKLDKPYNRLMAHGICVLCGKRRIVWLPLRYCDECLDVK